MKLKAIIKTIVFTAVSVFGFQKDKQLKPIEAYSGLRNMIFNVTPDQINLDHLTSLFIKCKFCMEIFRLMDSNDEAKHFAI